MNDLLPAQRQKLIQINAALKQAQQEWAPWLRDLKETLPQSHYLPLQRVEKERVFTWHKSAQSYGVRKDHVAAVFDMTNYHAKHYDQTNWNDLPDDATRPGGAHHCYWFHELYDHTYGANHLTWQQIAELGGMYLQMRCHYDRMITVRSKQAVAARSNQATVLEQLNQTLAQEESALKKALIEIDQDWLSPRKNPDNNWLDYQLTLHVWMLVDENNPRYTEQNGGELAQVQFSATGISQGKHPELKKLGDGKIHSSARFGVQLNQPCCFIYQALQHNNFLTQADFQCVDHVVVFAEVSAKTPMIIEF